MPAAKGTSMSKPARHTQAHHQSQPRAVWPHLPRKRHVEGLWHCCVYIYMCVCVCLSLTKLCACVCAMDLCGKNVCVCVSVSVSVCVCERVVCDKVVCDKVVSVTKLCVIELPAFSYQYIGLFPGPGWEYHCVWCLGRFPSLMIGTWTHEPHVDLPVRCWNVWNPYCCRLMLRSSTRIQHHAARLGFAVFVYICSSLWLHTSRQHWPKMAGLHRFCRVAAGGAHSLLVTERAEVLAWGSNSHGQVGNDSVEEPAQPRKQTVFLYKSCQGSRSP